MKSTLENIKHLEMLVVVKSGNISKLYEYKKKFLGNYETRLVENNVDFDKATELARRHNQEIKK